MSQAALRTAEAPQAAPPKAEAPDAAQALQHAARAAARLAELQRPDGHWAGDYGGPLFLMPGLLIACEISGAPLSDYQRARMIEYLTSQQNDDGGFGLHVEDRSTMFGSAMNYVAMRILGLGPDDPRCARARRWIKDHGGARSVPTWGKCWLAVLGCYSWDGLNPLPPELWLLPRALPIHPSNFWCHTRAVLLPMTYLYGRRAVGPQTDLVRALRSELYVEGYGEIDWRACRSEVHALDTYSPHTRLLDGLNLVLSGYERVRSTWLRRRALDFVMDQIHHEDESTGYLDIGPVSKPLHMLSVWFEDPRQPAFARHVERIADYLWDGRDGMKMQGYNGSQLWDLAFTMQALLEDPALADRPEVGPVLERAHGWLDANQVKEDVPDRERYFRNRTRGAFPFSTAEQAWSVTDCTAEGIKAALQMQGRAAAPLSEERILLAADLLIAEQNDDGGWSEYERARVGRWIEVLNAAEVFGEIMTGYSYPECTSACVQGLCAVRDRYPGHRRAEVELGIARGAAFLRGAQRDDGSWYGGWGICFTYATWFGIEGLLAATGGSGEDRGRVARAADFLVSKQRPDGGWGESYLACVEKRWVEHERAQPVQTAWALLGLLRAVEKLGPSQPGAQAWQGAARRAAAYLMATQTDDGWPYDMVYGVFNRNCMINYDNYRYYFPLWALARYSRLQRNG